MKDYLSEIDERFPVRNSAQEKAAFRSYAIAEAKEAGMTKAAEEEVEGHVNLVFGDPAKAQVIFTAHYDTPRRGLLPNMMFVTNKVLSWTYKLGIILVVVGIAMAAAFFVRGYFHLDFQVFSNRLIMIAVYLGVYFVLIALVLMGPKNKRNRNDNTSGTAAVLQMVRMGADRKDVAFILFDDEEKGKKGSKAYAARYPEIKKNALIVNMDCIGNGDTYVFVVSPLAQSDPLFAGLKETMENSGLNFRLYSAKKAQTNSDQRSFDKGIGICCCYYKPLVGYYTGRIHTNRDTVADPDTVASLANALAAFEPLS